MHVLGIVQASLKETFISHGPDGAIVARTLADLLARAQIATRLCGGGETICGSGSAAVHERIERSTDIVFVITPGWVENSWPNIEDYFARSLRKPAAFLAKLVLVDLSNGASVPAMLRPLLKTGFNFGVSQEPNYAAVVDMVVGSEACERMSPEGTAAPSVDRKTSLPGSVFVLGHPGSGKSAFCAFLKTRLTELGVPVVKIDAYSYLQVLFRIDQLRRDATRFVGDALCEFVILDLSVLDESVSLARSRLLARNAAAHGVTIVELAFSEGQALADAIESCPSGVIVHIDASLEACKRRNASRGALLQQTLRAATSSSEAFDNNSDVHYVPTQYYDRFALDPCRWDDGPSRLSRRFGSRYHRLENWNDELSAYTTSCQAFIETILLPFFHQETFPQKSAGHR